MARCVGGGKRCWGEERVRESDIGPKWNNTKNFELKEDQNSWFHQSVVAD